MRLVRLGCVSLVGLLCIAGCAHYAKVVDRADTETTLKCLSLDEYPRFKVLLGGAVREISIRDVRLIKINASESIMFEGELFFGAEIVMKDGQVVSKSAPKAKMQGLCYVSIRNTLSGKRRGEKFTIPLENVVQITWEN